MASEVRRQGQKARREGLRYVCTGIDVFCVVQGLPTCLPPMADEAPHPLPAP